MAKYGSDSKGEYAIVESGDTLSEICYEKFGDGTAKKYNQIATLNNLKSPHKIYIGQKIYLTGASSSNSSSSSSSEKKVIINFWGRLSSSSTPTLYVGWYPPDSLPTSEIENFEYEWEYTRPGIGKSDITNITSGKWWTASKGTTTEWETECAIPDDAELVRFRVRAISKTYSVESTDSKGNKITVDKTYWTCKWTDFQGDGQYKPYSTSTSLPPEPPDAPSVKLAEDDNLVLIAELNVDADELRATDIEFQIVQDNEWQYGMSTGTVAIDTNFDYVSYRSPELDWGHEYKVRCRSVRGSLRSDWSPYSNSVGTVPITPDKFTYREIRRSDVDGSLSVYLEWQAVNAAKTYDIQYATNPDYFDFSDQTTTISNIKLTAYEIFSLEQGLEYYFRFRAVNDAGESGWSAISEVVALGSPPDAPTTWSSTTTAMVDGPLMLYWVHNSKDGSIQKRAQLLLEAFDTVSLDENGNLPPSAESYWDEPVIVENVGTIEERSKTSSFNVTTWLQQHSVLAQYYEKGMVLRWSVRTAGVTGAYGDWSVSRVIHIYQEPWVSIMASDTDDDSSDGPDFITSYPIKIEAQTRMRNQSPISFHFTIAANDSFNTVDETGNDKLVRPGDVLYSRYVDREQISIKRVGETAYDAGEIEGLFETLLYPNDVNVDRGHWYTMTCVAYMDSGLTATETREFYVNWVESSYSPDANIRYDPDSVVTFITPYCKKITNKYHEVTYDSATDTYHSTYNVMPAFFTGYPVMSMYTAKGEKVYTEYPDNDSSPKYYYLESRNRKVYIDESKIAKRLYTYTEEGDLVYSGTSNIEVYVDGTVVGGDELFYHVGKLEEIVPDVSLSVYRREYDGTFTKLADGISSLSAQSITDPHPSLDFARYRIVAISDTTGAVSYYDTPGLQIGEKDIIIQWDEEWSSFEASTDAMPADYPYSGSMLRLPYNITTSDSYDKDVSLIEYVGRKRPVSYYGTQLGESSTWSAVIPKDDEETLYALRRLAVWPGDAYVREPSGTGYWANVSVSFSQKYDDLTVPVNLTIRRVEGGA